MKLIKGNKTQINNYSLLLMYKTSWEEEKRNEPDKKIIRTWIQYPFDVINTLKIKKLIQCFYNANSIMIKTEFNENLKGLNKDNLSVKDLVMILLHLNSWEEEGRLEKITRSIPFYSLETISYLQSKGYIRSAPNAKSIIIEENGVEYLRKLGYI